MLDTELQEFGTVSEPAYHIINSITTPTQQFRTNVWPQNPNANPDYWMDKPHLLHNPCTRPRAREYYIHHHLRVPGCTRAWAVEEMHPERLNCYVGAMAEWSKYGEGVIHEYFSGGMRVIVPERRLFIRARCRGGSGGSVWGIWERVERRLGGWLRGWRRLRGELSIMEAHWVEGEHDSNYTLCIQDLPGASYTWKSSWPTFSQTVRHNGERQVGCMS